MSTSLIRSVSLNGSGGTTRSTVSANRAAGLGVERGADDRPVGVPLAVAERVGVGVEPDDGLRRVVPGFEGVERAGEADGFGPDAERLAGLPVLGLDREERLRLEPVGPVRGSASGRLAGPSMT